MHRQTNDKRNNKKKTELNETQQRIRCYRSPTTSRFKWMEYVFFSYTDMVHCWCWSLIIFTIFQNLVFFSLFILSFFLNDLDFWSKKKRHENKPNQYLNTQKRDERKKNRFLVGEKDQISITISSAYLFCFVYSVRSFWSFSFQSLIHSFRFFWSNDEKKKTMFWRRRRKKKLNYQTISFG